EALKEVPGITAGFQFPVQMRFNELMTGARQDVVCKIFGEDLDTLALYAKKLGALVNHVEGTRNLYVEAVSGMPQITIRYNRSALAQYGLDISAVNRTVNTALAGQSTGMVFEGEKRFELVVRLSGERKKNLEDIRNLLVAAPNGTQIPLDQLAEVKIQNGPNQIQREDAKRRIVVGFNIAGRDVQTIVNELQSKVRQNLKLPTGYYITYGGSFENLNAAKQRLMIAVPVSLLLIFVLLFFAFNSVKDGLLIYSAIPLSAIGGIFFLALRGMPFSISAGIGFVALFGVAVLNGIVLVAEFNRIRKEEQKDIRQAVLEGTQHRLRPVLMTAFVASLGFFPMAISNGAGAEVQRPLATVVIGGLLVATFLTLFVLPVLYLFFENGFKFRLNQKSKLASLFIPAILMLASSNSFAQTQLDLKSATEIALTNNQNLKIEKLRVEYHKSLMKTAVVLPQTGFQIEAGQINSFYTDTRFNITQSFSLPVVYARQKTLLQSELSASVLNVAVRENELKRNVAQAFYLFLYQKKKEELLISLDSLYTGFYKRAQERFEKGESDILEKTTVETQLAEIQMQRQQLESDLTLSRLQFQLLLNTTTSPEPQQTGNVYNPVAISDSVQVDNHPQMRLLMQQQQIAAASINVEKAKLLPQLNLGYNNMSMRGIGADDKAYTAAQRFQSAQLGIGIPIFAGAQKARINSARINQDISRQSYQAGTQILKSQYLSALAEYRKFLTMVRYYETSGLQQAALITATANQQLAGGNINYLQWVQLINHATSIRSLYLDAVMNLNIKAIDLDYYLQN
ncbi:MAG: efflux RND transporter permease subunit, partial [Dyadobacter sp.]|uniref:efflux RND transporter permease subunit n=1 Tax=Dyadobacter sp. TaxID=1914288 RepID=UPI003266252D